MLVVSLEPFKTDSTFSNALLFMTELVDKLLPLVENTLAIMLVVNE
jgi:hypothetical protein